MLRAEVVAMPQQIVQVSGELDGVPGQRRSLEASRSSGMSD